MIHRLTVSSIFWQKQKNIHKRLCCCRKSQEPNEDGTWAEYPFDESTRLWVNTQHEEALGWFSQIINREKKSLDFAQTFARRNALKHLSGLQKAPGSEWSVAVLGWRPTSGNIVKWDATQYIQLQDKVGSLIQGNGEDFAPGRNLQIEKDAGKERISDEELDSEHESEDHETASEPIDVEHKEVKENSDWDKELEARIPKASQAEIDQIRRQVAKIAAEMQSLGYSLPRLIKKRQERRRGIKNALSPYCQKPLKPLDLARISVPN